ncbi:hypothetical protein COCMIDRAFT_30303 [Bipolaris oryzae ATCC 44560]|uniref:Uncharacterized protein n=1 Tax=Bipolaris oryzae ATCC 44560 TaxID=930090 RepID=W6YTF6_COCMI|nr:uncharacterized protein COCMIDRAFT_30303 [Bipolaris oryzae ATCC 44560]EUC40823.1 hypothetical protein COCMIDRAFT_30303 [Bipolaris oryzae ATCC 44560]
MSPLPQLLYDQRLANDTRQEDIASSDVEKSITSLGYLLFLSPIRRRILDSVSAFDAAKLVNLKLCILTAKEKEKYLKPIRDLVWDVPAVERLSREGMKLMLLGDGAYALEQRLHATERYLNSHGNGRLTIYLLGTFPVFTPTATTLDSLVEFSTTGHSNLVRFHCDKYQLGRVRAVSDIDAKGDFLMSFSVPMQASINPIKGSWYKVDDVPDRTVDLWVYVPSLRDRLCKEVRLTPLDVLRMVRVNPLFVSLPHSPLKPTFTTTCIKRKFRDAAHSALLSSLGFILTLRQLFHLYAGHCRLRKWLLTVAGVQSLEVTHPDQFSSDEFSVRQLAAHYITSSLGVNSGSRAAIDFTQVPNIRLFLDVAKFSTFGGRIALS